MGGGSSIRVSDKDDNEYGILEDDAEELIDEVPDLAT